MSTTASKYDDQSRPLRRALRLAVIASAIISVAMAALWGALRDLPGLWGVLLGAGIGFGFAALTLLSVLLTSKTDATTTGIVVLGGWLLKIVVLIIVLVIIRDLEFYDRWALFSTVAAVTVVMMASEVWGISTTNVTYVDTSQRASDGS